MQRKKQIHFVTVFLISFLFTITVSLQAQVPRTISFQGSLTNPDGSKLPDGQVSLEFMLYESETGGTAIWTETQSVNVKNSLFSAILGKVTPLTAAFDKPYWVGIKVNGNNELIPRIALTSSPYSLGAGAVVSQPGPGQNFQVKDSTGKVTSTISSNGDTWSAGTGKFGTGLVVGDTTVVPDTSSFTTIKTNKIEFGINKTLGILGANTGGGIGGIVGVYGWGKNKKVGVWGTSENSLGVLGTSDNGTGVRGSSLKGDGIVGHSFDGWAGHFKEGKGVYDEGKMKIGILPPTIERNYVVWSADHFLKVNSTPWNTSPFEIDHPLEPLNKNLYHNTVLSPDMMDVYNGNIVLEGNGEATVELPNWFEALNKNFRYQLTPIGAPALLYVSQKITNNIFKIAGGKAGMEVSWQVTGIRHDPYSKLHRKNVEEDKPIDKRGKYLHPDAYGQSVVDNK